MMKKFPFSQMIIELDKMFFDSKIKNMEQAEKQADLIEAYIEACGWTWDEILEEISNEKTTEVPSKTYN